MAKPDLSSTILAALIIGGALMAMVPPGLAQELKVTAPPKEHHHPHHHKNHSRAPPAEAPSAESPEEACLDSTPESIQDYIDNCTENVSPICGEEIVGSLFGTRNVSIPCCCQLLNIGMECHAAVVSVFAGLPDVKQGAPIIKANSHKVFNACLKEVRKNRKLKAKATACK
ncbi:protein DOWN-REGULATED IN DIF1 11-like [Coffea eugenioides]|uniref:protein DOWN-REGULATED IN DIF1 11-like n=1 Tax=Coffea eugenioides TaxID=49369 RepID=UPI000F60A7F0|nr:protein DOWN-REGULATED IN DIF1 11-like [Coffea eugenioides]